jgi:hypothetical protein
MSVNESIDSLSNATLTVTRTTTTGAYVDGIWVKGASTTFTIDAVIQPAFNLNRVIGGADLEGNVENQSVVEIYQVHTRTQLFTRKKGPPAIEPDLIEYDDAQWTVARVEEWDIDGEVHYHAVITRVTHGAS